MEVLGIVSWSIYYPRENLDISMLNTQFCIVHNTQVEYILVKTSSHHLQHWLHDLAKVWFLKVRDNLRKAISKECNVLKVNCTIKDYTNTILQFSKK